MTGGKKGAGLGWRLASQASFDLLLVSCLVKSSNMPAVTVPNDALQTISLEAEDGSIRGNFMRVGACITDLFVKDKNGDWLDVVTGFDDRSKYLEEPPSYFGAVIGRYGTSC